MSSFHILWSVISAIHPLKWIVIANVYSCSLPNAHFVLQCCSHPVQLHNRRQGNRRPQIPWNGGGNSPNVITAQGNDRSNHISIAWKHRIIARKERITEYDKMSSNLVSYPRGRSLAHICRLSPVADFDTITYLIRLVSIPIFLIPTNYLWYDWFRR